MLRLLDPRTGRLDDVPRGPLRLHAHGTGLRVHLVADLLRRTAERCGHRVIAARSARVDLDRPLEDFGVRPMEPHPPVQASFHVVDAALTGSLDPVGIGDASPAADMGGLGGADRADSADSTDGGDGRDGRDGASSTGGSDGAALSGHSEARTTEPAFGRYVTVAAVHGDWRGTATRDDVDPLAIRLALLATRYREPIDLGPEVVSAAAARLSGWRALVAGWAREPGRPMDRRYADAAQRALADDLDMESALATLDRLAEDDGVPAGAKLETFIHVDLLLGLDLVRDIGR